MKLFSFKHFEFFQITDIPHVINFFAIYFFDLNITKIISNNFFIYKYPLKIVFIYETLFFLECLYLDIFSVYCCYYIFNYVNIVFKYRALMREIILTVFKCYLEAKLIVRLLVVVLIINEYN